VSARKSKRKSKRKGGDTTKASQRIFYRDPWLMIHDAVFSAPGLVISILLFGWSVVFIKIFGG